MYILNLKTAEIIDHFREDFYSKVYPYLILSTACELKLLKDILDIDEITFNDCLEFDENIKLDLFDNYDFLSLNTCELSGNEAKIEDISNIGLKGIEGKKKINQIMDYFRNNEISLNNYEILVKEDMKLGTIYNLKTKETQKNPLPESNVIKYHLNNDCWFVLRPSGTEPKLKVYYGIINKI